MSIWILQQALMPEEEERIASREMLELPFDHLPDLSQISNQQECRKLLQTLYPDEPPEGITRRLDRIWKQYTEVQLEDIIAVPLKTRREMALAIVTGRYKYEVGTAGEDRHLIPVTWYDVRMKLTPFGKNKALFDQKSEPMYEVLDAQARIAIRDKLPHKYNRFAKWKWLMIIFVTINAIRFLQMLVTRN